MPDVLVCDDLATEVGDFIAVDLKQKKLIVLHAKVFKNKGSLSAKEMHEVVAQAKKNLCFFDPAELPPANRAAKWNARYEVGKRGIPRIRRTQGGYQTGDQIVALIRELLHSTSVQKEVWLVLGNAFTAEELQAVMKLEDISEWHWIQLLYLIHSCHASAQALGARLKILTGGRRA
jgi:hypothetical protein